MRFSKAIISIALFTVFISLAVPQGVMGGTLYLDVPNDLTAAQFTKRMRAPILEALTRVAEDVQDPASNFRVVVNPDLADAHLTAPIPLQSSVVSPPAAPQVGRPPLEEPADAASTSRKKDSTSSISPPCLTPPIAARPATTTA